MSALVNVRGEPPNPSSPRSDRRCSRFSGIPTPWVSYLPLPRPAGRSSSVFRASFREGGLGNQLGEVSIFARSVVARFYRLRGDDDIRHGRRLFSSLADSSRCVSLAHAGVYFPPQKRARRSPRSSSAEEGWGFPTEIQSEQVSIDSLPDQCLFEILRRVEGARERSLSACVSKRWLHQLSSILPADVPPSFACKAQQKPLLDLNESSVLHLEEQVDEDDELLHSRCLEGKEATDIRLVSVAVGAALGGGLRELFIRGSHASRPVTDVGLGAVARSSPSLKVLSLWNSLAITDEGLAQIASHCPLLEKLDLCRCAAVSDKGLAAVAAKCPKLSSLVIESCPRVGNDGLQAIGRCCPLLRSVSIANLGLVADQGVASLVSSAASSLEKLKLQHVNITDASLAAIGHYGVEIADLVFNGLPLIGERGFWVMGSGRGLRKLRSFAVTSCAVTDVGLKAIAQGCPALKKLHLRRCIYLSDAGLSALASAANSLEALELEECNRITLAGILGALVASGAKLRSLELAGCMGVKDEGAPPPASLPRRSLSLQSLKISRCPGFGDASLALVGRLCPRLQQIQLRGLAGVTDTGLLPVFQGCEMGLDEVVLGGCVSVTDVAVTALVKQHGGTLQTLGLEGCRKVTDDSLVAVADDCILLENLDVSKCSVGDDGVAALASAVGVGLQVLSLSGCARISARSLQHLSMLDHCLEGLNLQMCNAISSHAISSLQKKMPQCDILS